MAVFLSLALFLALLPLVPLKVSVCALAGAKMGAALFACPFAGGLALRVARMRARRGKRRHKPRRPSSLALPWAIARRLLPHVRLEEVRAQGELGLADAASTALAAGLLQALLRAVGAATGARVCLRVQPQFQSACLSGELSGIASLRVGHIISAALAGILENSRRHPKWKSIPSKTS